MRVGDVLEWLAAACITYGLYVIEGRAGAAITAAACLIYLAQCYSTQPLVVGKVWRTVRKLRVRRLARR